MELAVMAWYPEQGTHGALSTGLAWANHIGHNVMPLYRTEECHPPACPAPAPSHHQPRFTQLGLALGAVHIARPGAGRANYEGAGPWAGANQQQGQTNTPKGKAAARAGRRHSQGESEPSRLVSSRGRRPTKKQSKLRSRF